MIFSLPFCSKESRMYSRVNPFPVSSAANLDMITNQYNYSLDSSQCYRPFEQNTSACLVNCSCTYCSSNVLLFSPMVASELEDNNYAAYAHGVYQNIDYHQSYVCFMFSNISVLKNITPFCSTEIITTSAPLPFSSSFVANSSDMPSPTTSIESNSSFESDIYLNMNRSRHNFCPVIANGGCYTCENQPFPRTSIEQNQSLFHTSTGAMEINTTAVAKNYLPSAYPLATNSANYSNFAYNIISNDSEKCYDFFGGNSVLKNTVYDDATMPTLKNNVVSSTKDRVLSGNNIEYAQILPSSIIAQPIHKMSYLPRQTSVDSGSTKPKEAASIGAISAASVDEQESKPVIDGNFDCKVCAKHFKHRSNLKIHMRIHSKNAIVCRFCDKKFARVSNMKQHERVHTNERPYGCNICHQYFKQKHRYVCIINLSLNIRYK